MRRPNPRSAADSDSERAVDRPEQSLVRIQAASGLVFATFLALHLANTMLGAAGQGTYDGYQRAARAYYQFPVVEVVAVVGAALVHVVAGLGRILRRRRRARAAGGLGKQGTAPSLRVRLHRYSGYYLMLVFTGHVVATRGPGLLGHAADFSFLTFSLWHWPGIFYPYYVLFALSGVFHLGHGALVALRVLRVKLPASITTPGSKPFWVSVAAGGALAITGVLGLGGRFFPVDTHRFEEFQALYERVLPASVRPWR